MRNLGQNEIWSLRGWTIGGVLVGLVIGVVVLVTVGWTFSVAGAPFVFALSAHVTARQHNWTVRRYRRRHDG